MEAEFLRDHGNGLESSGEELKTEHWKEQLVVYARLHTVGALCKYGEQGGTINLISKLGKNQKHGIVSLANLSGELVSLMILEFWQKISKSSHQNQNINLYSTLAIQYSV